MTKMRITAIILLLLGSLVGYFVYSTQANPETRFPFKLGLDLSGGTHLVYQANVAEIPGDDVQSSMDALRDVIENRINILGVSEPIVQVERGGVIGEAPIQKLIVELPGVTDVNEAIAIIGKTPLLEFRLPSANAEEIIKSLDGKTEEEQLVALQNIFVQTGLTGRLVSRAQLLFDQTTNEPLVGLEFNDEGKELFARITRENIGNVLAIFLDGNLISRPVIQQEIREGKAQITGNFKLDEARRLVRDLNYGALPVPIELISTQTIGAALGHNALQGSIYAGIWAFVFISIFLIAWYRAPGLIAVVALSIYAILMLAAFKLVSVTLTAAGIAGFILSIGMAVDANILIFERMKEEMKKGKTIADSVKEGFGRAWPSIRDSNISSLITALILFLFPSSNLIKGFALIFAIGVAISMFTAITVSRSFLLAVSRENSGRIARFLFSNGLTK